MVRLCLLSVSVLLVACTTTKVTVIGNSTQKVLDSRSVQLCKDSTRIFLGKEFYFPIMDVDTIKVDQTIQRQLVYSTVFLSTLVLAFKSSGVACRSMYPPDPVSQEGLGGREGCYYSLGWASVFIDGLIVSPLITMALVDRERVMAKENIPDCKEPPSER